MNIEITVSYSRNVSHELYGGNAFETSNHFCSLKNVIDEETDPKQAHEELSKLAEEMVRSRVDAEIAGFQGGITSQDFKSWLQDYVAGRKIDGETYYKMSRYQQDIVQTVKKGRATAVRDQKKAERQAAVPKEEAEEILREEVIE